MWPGVNPGSDSPQLCMFNRHGNHQGLVPAGVEVNLSLGQLWQHTELGDKLDLSILA